jgi:hypothetical protein
MPGVRQVGYESIHSCKGFPVTDAAWERFYAMQVRHWCDKCQGLGRVQRKHRR